MNKLLVLSLLLASACGASKSLEIYDALDTTNTYDCWGVAAPAPIQMVIGIDESGGTFHLYTCDNTCGQVKVEVASSKDGTNFTGGVHTPADSRGCTVNETLTATVSYSGNSVEISEHSVEVVSVGCDQPGTCTQDVTITGIKR